MSDFLDIATIATPNIDATAAVNEALAKGAPLYLSAIPDGDVWVWNAVDLVNAASGKVTIRGAGPGATRMASSLPNTPCLTWSNVTGTGDLWLDLQGFEITSMPVVNGPGSGISLPLFSGGRHAGNVTMRDLWFRALPMGLQAVQTNNLVLDNIFGELCTTLLQLTDCGDVDMNAVKAQNGSSWGIVILGTAAGRASHQAEGTRMTNCSTNGQAAGLLVQGYGGAVNCANGSFTSAPEGALRVDGSNFCRFIGGELESGPSISAATVTSSCCGIQFVGVQASGSPVGFDLNGTAHVLSGCLGTGNYECDVMLEGDACNVVGGIFNSAGTGPSILEVGGANFNVIVGAMMSKGATLIGPNSKSY